MAIETAFDESKLRELKRRNLFNRDHMSDEIFEEILRDIRIKPVESSVITGIDPDHPPTVNAGLAICYNCRSIYWITPSMDILHIPGQTGDTQKDRGYCWPCTNYILRGQMKKVEAKSSESSRNS